MEGAGWNSEKRGSVGVLRRLVENSEDHAGGEDPLFWTPYFYRTGGARRPTPQPDLPDLVGMLGLVDVDGEA